MSPHYNSKQHDIGILRQDGTTAVGLMLVKQKDSGGNYVPFYRTIYDSYLVNQYTTAPDYGATNPQEELHIIGDSWREGFGLYIADAETGERYFSSIGCDLRFKDMAIAGPTPVAVTVPTYTAVDVTDAGFELWNDATTPTSWTEDWAIVSRSTTKREGTYSAYIEDPGGGSGSYTLIMHQSLTWNNEYKSRAFTWKEYISTGTAAYIKIAIYDGVSRTYSTEHTGGGGWEELSVTKALGATATELTLEVYVKLSAGGAAGAYVDGGTFIDPTDGITPAYCTADFNDKFYIARGNNLCKLNAGGTAFDYVYSFPTTITCLKPFTDDYLYIALGTSEPYWYMHTNEITFTKSTATNKTYQFFHTLHSTAPTLYGNSAVSGIRSTVNPLNGGTAWSAAVTAVGSSFYSITGFEDLGGLLYIMKEDKPYYLDSTPAIQDSLAPKLEATACATSGKNSYADGQYLYIPFGQQGLLQTDATTNVYLDPSTYTTNNAAFVGRVQAVSGDEQWIFIAVDNSTAIEILAGRSETVGATTSWRWHPIAEITLAGAETMFTTSVVDKRLWIFSTDSSNSIYYIKLYTQYGNVTNDSQRKFKTDTYFITPFYHGDFKGSDKAWIKIDAELGHAYDVNIYWECHYQKFGDSVWTDAGDLKGSATSRKATLFFPVDASSNKPVSPMFRLKFVAKTNDDQKTPILVNFDVKAILKATARNVVECAVRVADKIIDKKGNHLQGVNAAYIRTVIEEAQDATWPVTFYDIWGSTVYVNVMPREPFSDVVKSQYDESLEEVFYLRLQIVDLA